MVLKGTEVFVGSWQLCCCPYIVGTWSRMRRKLPRATLS